MPTGKPTNAEFPTSASTPPVNIMTPEPGLRRAEAAAPCGAPLAQPRRRRRGPRRQRPGAGGGEKTAAARSARPAAPVRSRRRRGEHAGIER